MKPMTTDVFKLSGRIQNQRDDAFDWLRRGALTWVEQKLATTFPRAMPADAWKGEAFVGDLPGLKLEAVALPDSWTLTLEHQDAPTFGDLPVPGRTWTTDLAIRSGPETTVGVRLRCTTLSRDEDDVPRTCPRIVKMWAKSQELMVDTKIQLEPTRIESLDDLERLYQLVISSTRVLPVVVLSQADKTAHRWPVTDWVLDEAMVAKAIFGFGHCYLLPRDLGFEWTRLVGRPWSVFNGAVRTYLPQLNLETQSPFEHPMATVDRILATTVGDLTKEPAFAAQLIAYVKRVSTRRFVKWDVPFVTEARSIASELEHQRIRGQIDSLDQGHQGEKGRLREELESVLTQVESLKRENAHWVEELEAAETTKAQIEQEKDRLRQENGQLRLQLDLLRRRIEGDGAVVDTELVLPETYDEFPEWVDTYLKSRVVLHPRAIRGLREAQFHDPSLVAKALLLLANEYRQMRLEGGKTRFEAALAEMGLSYDGAITKTRAGEQDEEYFVRWPPVNGPRRMLEMHVRKGVTKDQRTCLAIYFFWSEEETQVVVGWLPSHLKNRQT
ncbi:MAG: hypothetical protein ABI672_10605 [Vicinamibacteria bacterium]